MPATLPRAPCNGRNRQPGNPARKATHRPPGAVLCIIIIYILYLNINMHLIHIHYTLYIYEYIYIYIDIHDVYIYICNIYIHVYSYSVCLEITCYVLYIYTHLLLSYIIPLVAFFDSKQRAIFLIPSQLPAWNYRWISNELVDKHHKFCRLRHTPDIWWISQYHHVKSLALTNMWGKWWHSPTRRHVFWWCLVSSPRRLPPQLAAFFHHFVEKSISMVAMSMMFGYFICTHLRWV